MRSSLNSSPDAFEQNGLQEREDSAAPESEAQSPVNEATQLAQRMLEECGYFIVAYWGLLVPEVGEVQQGPTNTYGDKGLIPGPFRVIGEATAEEWLEQVARHAPEDLESGRANVKYAMGFRKLVAE